MKRTAAVVAAAAVVGAGIGLGVSQLTQTPKTVAPSCSAPSAIASAPAGATVTLCDQTYAVTTLEVDNTTNLTIHGNGATLQQAAQPSGANHPILDLLNDSDISIDHLTLNGSYNGNNGGDYYEGDFGVREEQTSGELSSFTITNIQGDCVVIQAPNDIPGAWGLNSGSLLGSTINNCGYHGLTVEAANGWTFAGNTVSNVGLDAMDFEVDGCSTTFYYIPLYYAEDNVNIYANRWSSFGGDWFASLQGQVPGVQEDNIALTYNTINSPSGLVDILGTNPAQTTKPYLNIGLTISNNTGQQGAGVAYGEHGPITIRNVAAINVSDNTIPVLYDANAVAAYDAFYGLNVQHNTFSGAYAPLVTDSGASVCGNHYGNGAGQADPACPG